MRRNGVPSGRLLRDVAASYRAAVVDSLLLKVRRALEAHPEAKALLVAGGVAANTLLRREAERIASEFNLKLIIPPIELCTDNAAMVAGLGYSRVRNGLLEA